MEKKYAYKIEFNDFGVVYAFAETFEVAEKLLRKLEQKTVADFNNPERHTTPWEIKSIVKLAQTNEAVSS